MPEDKRTFESQTLEVKSVQPNNQAKVKSGLMLMKTSQGKNQYFPFSKDVILRLINWFERE